jgi:hypothetical protein
MHSVQTVLESYVFIIQTIKQTRRVLYSIVCSDDRLSASVFCHVCVVKSMSFAFPTFHIFLNASYTVLSL